MGVNSINVGTDIEDKISRFAVSHQLVFFSALISQFRSTVLFSRAHGKASFSALTSGLTRGGSDRIRRSGRVLTEQSKIAKERPSHEGDPKDETRSVE